MLNNSQTRRVLEDFEYSKAMVFNYQQALSILNSRHEGQTPARDKVQQTLSEHKSKLDDLRHTLRELGIDESTMKEHDPSLL